MKMIPLGGKFLYWQRISLSLYTYSTEDENLLSVQQMNFDNGIGFKQIGKKEEWSSGSLGVPVSIYGKPDKLI